MNQEKKYDIFISYSRKDFEDVNALVNMFKQRIPTLDIWFDLDGIESGEEFDDKIIEAIDNSFCMIFAVSNHSLQSKWTKNEVMYAKNTGKKIIPVLLSGATLKGWFLFNFGRIDCIDLQDEKQIEKVLNNLEDWTHKELIAPNKGINNNEGKQSSSSSITTENIQDLILLGAKMGSDGVPEPLQDRFINDLVKTKRLATAQNNLGFNWTDPTKRIKWLKEAAQNGSGAAMINLAYIYENGVGVERDINKAIDYYRDAIVHGHDEYIDHIKELINGRDEKIGEPNNQLQQSFQVNGVSFNMIKVQGGAFIMGATEEQGRDAYSDEMPPHQVTLSDYYIGETLVTQELWQAVLGKNSSKFKGDQNPVERVTWEDCQIFIQKLNQLTGKQFRLPTEAEWEFAARGGSQSKGYKYAGSNNLDDVAWYSENSNNKTHPVKQKQANELGLYDMSGNVYEWCQDWYGDYSNSEQTNPIGSSKGSYRVCRGGSWHRNTENCRVSFRYYVMPTDCGGVLGLRLAL